MPYNPSSEKISPGLVPLSIVSKLPWHRGNYTAMVCPHDSIGHALQVVGFAEEKEVYFVVCDGHACLESESVGEKKNITIFPIMMGG